MDNQFKRLLNLVRRTGDRLVVTDQNGEDTYVLMGLEAYEKLAVSSVQSDPEPCLPSGFDDFTDDYSDDDYDEEDYYNENGHFDFDEDWKTPRESLAVGANGNSPSDDVKFESEPSKEIKRPETNETSSWQTPKDIWETMKPAGDNSETWDATKFGPSEQKIVEEKFGSQINEIPSVSEIPVASDASVASAASKKPEDEPGEEQFYLEPIE
ncbi:MAG: type II toxin-antitoxin system Phd/YefM family antitoxin [Candidatus Uhrbacteria bacterium]